MRGRITPEVGLAGDGNTVAAAPGEDGSDEKNTNTKPET